jgi:hypothetical protein
VIKLLVPKHARFVAARSSSHEKKAWYAFALQHREHVGQRVQQTVVASHENSAWRKLPALLNPGAKVLWANYIVVSLEELELPSKNLRPD